MPGCPRFREHGTLPFKRECDWMKLLWIVRNPLGVRLMGSPARPCCRVVLRWLRRVEDSGRSFPVTSGVGAAAPKGFDYVVHIGFIKEIIGGETVTRFVNPFF